ncbi:hypothetical protein [Spirochaeta africana]|uniref:Uncharacterized protein n=1 Tax=Spirochaeta africana (strain ATCC 700263 / DSM 8902 / Z-7692) TaxID=889378 RepID=H9UJZ6_SPIAZ|nr:hypothetical protein [Spirochaeta africana]AFG37839.1 hypothetical protein Spiaf_1782 [Spirochaeta africana DSM 8902]
MKSRATALLMLVVILCGITAAVFGIWSGPTGDSFRVESVRGQDVEIYGRGLYQLDSAFRAPILIGTDMVTLVLAIPLLITALIWSSAGTLRARMFAVGILAYFLYLSSSLAFGVMFNRLMPLYIVYFSASLFAFIGALRSIDLQQLDYNLSPYLPRRTIAGFLFLAGLSLTVWLAELIPAAAGGTVPPHLGAYTTEITHVIDLGVLLPLALLAAWLLLRRNPLGYLIAGPMLALNALIGPVVIAQTVVQRLHGVAITPMEFTLFVLPFAAMSLLAALLWAILLRGTTGDSESTGTVA